MNDYREIIRAAEFSAMSPDAVAAHLHQRGQQTREERRKDEVSKEVEASMLARDEHAINLALAQHGRFFATLKSLFFSATPGSATRLAVLSNAVAEPDTWRGMPEALLGDEEQCAAWLASADLKELVALFENRTLTDDFLRRFLGGGPTWEALSDDGRVTAVSALSRNPRMRTPQDERSLDGQAAYDHGSVFNAAWKLAFSAPTDERWAYVLADLYARQLPESSIKNPLEGVARWMPTDGPALKKETEEAGKGYLTNHQKVRRGLGRLALKSKRGMLDALLTSDDAALRAAAYSYGDMSAARLAAAYERDGELLLNEALENPSVWRTSEGRDALKEIAWASSKDDENAAGLASVAWFNAQERAMAREHPEWFSTADSEALSTPASQADLQALSERMGSAAQLEHVKESMRALRHRTDWTWWVVLFIAAVSARAFFR